MRSSGNKGFTLLEVLVALAILTIALASTIKVVANQSLNAEYLRDKTFAHWVAMNQIAELHVKREWPPIGKKEGTEEMGLHEWHWQRIIMDTPDVRVRRLQINVFRDRDDVSPITQLTSFLAQPK
jgi:general secretion pathway protein I